MLYHVYHLCNVKHARLITWIIINFNWTSQCLDHVCQTQVKVDYGNIITYSHTALVKPFFHKSFFDGFSHTERKLEKYKCQINSSFNDCNAELQPQKSVHFFFNNFRIKSFGWTLTFIWPHWYLIMKINRLFVHTKLFLMKKSLVVIFSLKNE